MLLVCTVQCPDFVSTLYSLLDSTTRHYSLLILLTCAVYCMSEFCQHSHNWYLLLELPVTVSFKFLSMHWRLSLAVFVATTFCPDTSLYVSLTLLACTVHYLALLLC